MSHITVLLEEAVDALALSPASTVVDATVGSAGHALAICARLGREGHYIGIDADPAAIAAARTRLGDVMPRVTLVVGNFAELTTHLSTVLAPGVGVDAILADLGWRIEQFTDGGRGFSFQCDEPLLMTFGDPASYPFTARDIVGEWSEDQLRTIIHGYGDERYAARIARAIVRARDTAPILTSGQLVAIILDAVPASYRHGRIHPATRTFQALRMTVNDELTVVDTLITSAQTVLRPGGRLAIISFHSSEDRIVKHRFREWVAAGAVLITKKPITPSAEACRHNPRARSAKLRVISSPTSP
jgi:16S rRNA (cytosine1402-N4)-methyltransferase